MISTITSLVLTTTLPTLANTTSTLSSSIHYNVTQPFHIFNNIGETSNNATIANVVDNVIANVNGNVVNGTVLLSASSSLDNPFYNLTGNETTTYQQPVFPNYIRVTSMVFCIIIMCLGVIGNVMVPIVILKTKDMRNSTNIFLMNLSVADLMVLLVCTPTVLVEVNTKPETWVLGEEMCKAVPFVEFTVAHASVLTILAISFERYYAICEPLRAGYVCTKARASLICLLAWFFAAICTSPILSISEYRLLPYVDGTTVPACRMPVNNAWPFTYFLVTIVAFFIIPMIILIVLYCVIARTLITDAANIVLNQHLDNYNLRARRQVVLMLGTVVVSFFLCLIPFRVFSIWIILVSEETVSTLGAKKFFIILFFCRVMVYLNSAVNPILYNLMSTKFRDAFLRVCCGRRSRFNFRRGGRLRNGTFSTTITSYRNSTLRQGSVNFRTTRSQSLRTIQNESPDLGRNSSNESMDSKTRLAKDSNNIFNEHRSNKNSKISSDVGYTFSALKHIEEVNELSQSSDNNDVQVHFNSDGSGPDYDTYASIKLNGKFEKMQPNGYRKSSGKNADEFILQESLIRDTDSTKDAESLV